MAQPKDDDEYMQLMQDYLRTVDLRDLDLDAIDPRAETHANAADTGTPWWKLGGFLAAMATIIYLPHTTFYQLHDNGVVVMWGVSAVGLFLGLSAGPWLWRQALAAQTRAAALPRPTLPAKPIIPPTVTRWLMLLAAIGLGCVLYFALPHDAVWMGNGYAMDWFLGVGVALAIGILLGRWLIAQASATPAKPVNRTPIKLPPWFKWVTFTFLLGAALFALFGNQIFNDEGNGMGFGMSGVGLLVGIFGAIWLARRFDEMEARLSARTRNRAAALKIGENR